MREAPLAAGRGAGSTTLHQSASDCAAASLQRLVSLVIAGTRGGIGHISRSWRPGGRRAGSQLAFKRKYAAAGAATVPTFLERVMLRL